MDVLYRYCDQVGVNSEVGYRKSGAHLEAEQSPFPGDA